MTNGPICSCFAKTIQPGFFQVRELSASTTSKPERLELAWGCQDCWKGGNIWIQVLDNIVIPCCFEIVLPLGPRVLWHLWSGPLQYCKNLLRFCRWSLTIFYYSCIAPVEFCVFFFPKIFLGQSQMLAGHLFHSSMFPFF